jgi:Na+/H+ antiporter NhaD/arsenite permease-like protein
VVALGIAFRRGNHIAFWHFPRYGIVVTALSIALAWVYVWLRYFA